MNPDSTLAVTNTCPKDGVHLYYTFTDATLVASLTQAHAVHILELRQALQDVFVARVEVEPAYTDPVTLVGVPIKAAHIQELRDAVVGLE